LVVCLYESSQQSLSGDFADRQFGTENIHYISDMVKQQLPDCFIGEKGQAFSQPRSSEERAHDALKWIRGD
jgi:hypothetical protein